MVRYLVRLQLPLPREHLFCCASFAGPCSQVERAVMPHNPRREEKRESLPAVLTDEQIGEAMSRAPDRRASR